MPRTRLVRGPRPSWSCLQLLWLIGWAVPAPAFAQAIRGVVLDDQNLAPVSGASVRLLAGETVILGREADALGRFFLPVPEDGRYLLEVARLGYVTARSQPVRVEQGDTVDVEFRVLPDALLLDPITVMGRSNRGRNLFERRRTEWGRGVFLGPEAIDSIAPRHPAEVFRAVDDVYVLWGFGELGSGGVGRLPSVRSTKGRGCLLYMVDRVPVRVEPWVDFMQPWAGSQLAAVVGEDVVAVEVYRSIREVPPDLARYTHEMRMDPIQGGRVAFRDRVNCGLVVFWTGAGW
jgi:hypothetical protein